MARDAPNWAGYDLDGAFTVTNSLRRHELPEPDENEMSNIYSEDRVRISDSIKACFKLPPVNVPDEPTNAFESST